MNGSDNTYRYRQFSPLDRVYPIFELLIGDDVLLDFSATDDGVIEICFHEKAANFCTHYHELSPLLEEGKKLVEEAIREEKNL